jgi:hypothetical protein
MADRAAHLVDDVFPDVPVRQWVLTLPPRLRYQLAWNHDLCRAVVGVFMRAVLRGLRAQARREGVVDGQGGAVAIVQRFGGALNLNIHVHALVVDGVFGHDRGGRMRFHSAVRLTDLDVAEVLATVEARVMSLLDRRGLSQRDEAGSAGDAWEAETPVLAGLAAASVQGTLALGRSRGARVRRLGQHTDGMEPVAGPRHACGNGFDLHANVRVPAGQRDRLEGVCRYALRPPVAADHVNVTEEGDVVLQLRHRWADGTTHLRFDPLEFLGRLAVLVPRPRINLILYYGVLGARAAWRRQVVRRTATVPPGAVAAPEPPRSLGHGPGKAADPEAPPRARGQLWAELMRRMFGFDVLSCPRCGGRLRLVALIEQASVIRRILGHLGLPTEAPEPCAARAPPLFDDVASVRHDGDPSFNS